MKRRVFTVLGSALFLILAPGTVAGVIPWWLSQWRIQAPFSGFSPIRVIGAALIVAGVLILVHSFARFAIQGLGTPAIVYPPRHLVIAGFYRYVRNPMYLAVVSTILGQAIVLGSRVLLAYAGLVWLVCHLFVVGCEEPALRRRFGPTTSGSVKTCRDGYRALRLGACANDRWPITDPEFGHF